MDSNQNDLNLTEKRKKRNQNDKKRKKIKKWGKNLVVDKNKLTMFDLLSYNPPAVDVFKESTDEDKPTDELNEEVNELTEDEEKMHNDSIDLQIDLPIDQSNTDDNEEDKSIGPRVKINENGEIVLDETSLIVKRKKPKDNSIKTVYEDDKTLSTRTNYSSFKKPGKANERKLRWTGDETVKFYTALTIIGTDFTLMSELFFRDQRSRVDLKNKFKQEEKCHKVLIDNALKKSDLTSLDLENFNFDLFATDETDSVDSNPKETDT